ncbi:uncharacterized protein LOC128962276 [Oppia nitens]|uniref:uncharacterized protein LOC128962276 n=1 Tax=Oppia nitens TaxID=1686743 RepID=UPI0023DC509C|nr:uncharacterized protein LOC128962276 [Oppia nitens]
MSTSISLGTDLKDYLNSRSDETSSSLTSNVKNFFTTNKTKEWFYQPLSTEEVANDGSQLDASIGGNERQESAKRSWFSSFSLSSSTQQESSISWLPSLSRTQRIIGFIVFVLMGLFCFTLSSLYIPVLVFKARKFALLFTLGSLFIVLSFSVLWGPISHMKHLFSKERLPFTLTYFGSLITTLYFALKVQSTLFTAIFALIQVIALIWYVMSYLPGGQTGLMFFTKIATKAAAKSLPV